MLDLEFNIARELVPASKERNYLPLYNPYSIASATAKWPNIDWNLYLSAFLETPSFFCHSRLADIACSRLYFN